jgi:hypothetical protein
LSGRHFFRKRPPDVGEGHSRKKCLFLLYHITVDTDSPSCCNIYIIMIKNSSERVRMGCRRIFFPIDVIKEVGSIETALFKERELYVIKNFEEVLVLTLK